MVPVQSGGRIRLGIENRLKLAKKTIKLYNVNLTGSTLLDPSKDNVLYRLGVWPGHLKISVKKLLFFNKVYFWKWCLPDRACDFRVSDSATVKKWRKEKMSRRNRRNQMPDVHLKYGSEIKKNSFENIWTIFDHKSTLQLIIIGDSGVGKTSFMDSFVEGSEKAFQSSV